MTKCEYCGKGNPKLKNVDGWFCDEDCHHYWVDEKLSSEEYDTCHCCGKVVPVSMLSVCEECGDNYCENCAASPLDDLDATKNLCKWCYPRGTGVIGRKIDGFLTDYRVAPPEVRPRLKTGYRVKINLQVAQVWAICGKRGSGKSYTSNVLIEEILDQNPYTSIVVIDSMGLYFSLKYPNNRPAEYQDYSDKLEPKGYQNIRVLIPEGDIKKHDKRTYDGIISIRADQLTITNWLETFNLEGTDPQGQLFTILISKIRKSRRTFSIDDMLTILDYLEDEIKLHPSTIQAVRSKLMAANHWAIFSLQGTDLKDLCQPGVATIIDVSESSKYIAILLVSFLSNQIYEQRKSLSRAKMHREIGISVAVKDEDIIPPVWLVIEEAHNFLGRTKKTQSVASLVQYIKEGRSPGCSLITVTQEPKALDTSALTQIQGLIVHTLSHKRDINAVKEITPCRLPENFEKTIRGLKPGQAYVCNSEYIEAILTQIRPRHSVHLARTETVDIFKGTDLAKLSTPPVDLQELQKTEVKKLSERIAEYRQQIEKLNEKITQLEKQKISDDDIKEYQERIKELETTIEEKDEMIRTVTQDLEAAQQKAAAVISQIDEETREEESILEYQTVRNRIEKMKTRLENLPTTQKLILQHLITFDGRSFAAEELASWTDLAASTIQKHCRGLKKKNLIFTSKRGQKKIYKNGLRWFIQYHFRGNEPLLKDYERDVIYDELKKIFVKESPRTSTEDYITK
jgi:hypothetical protein